MSVTTKIIVQQILNIDDTIATASKFPRYTVTLGNSISSITASELIASIEATAKSAAAAKDSEIASKISELNAKDSENQAAISAGASEVSATQSATSATQSANSAGQSADSAAASKVSETNAKTSETNAKTSETNAKTSETNAKVSETNAAGSATSADQSVTAIQGLKSDVEQLKADTQTIKDNAVTETTALKDAAAASAVQASNSAAEATTQASNAAGSAQSASTDASRAEVAAGKAEGIISQALLKDNNLSDLSNVNAARQNLALDRLEQHPEETILYSSDTKDKFLTIHNNDDQWGIYSRRIDNWVPLPEVAGGTGVRSKEEFRESYNIPTKDECLLRANNLSDLTNVDYARNVLRVGPFETDGVHAFMYSPDRKYRLVIRNDGLFVYQNGDGTNTIPFSVSIGGTGAVTPEGARQNLGVDKLIEYPAETTLWTPTKDKYLTLPADQNYWGVYSAVNGGYVPLPIFSGGTGATTDAGARNNLGLGEGSWPVFKNLLLKNVTDETTGWVSSGLFDLGLYSMGGTERVTARLYAETNLASPDQFTIALVSNGKVTYLHFNADGELFVPTIKPGDLETTRKNFRVERLVQTDDFTILNSPDGTRLVLANNNKVVFQDAAGKVIALPVSSGGTGSLTAEGARTNLELGTDNDVSFKSLATTDGNVTVPQGKQVGVRTGIAGNKDIFLTNITSDGTTNDMINSLEGHWYDDIWRLGGVRGVSSNLAGTTLSMIIDGKTTSFNFSPEGSGYGRVESPRGFYGKCSATSWAGSSYYNSSPFFSEFVSNNDGSYTPIVVGGTQSTGGYRMRSSFGLISSGNAAWPRGIIHLLGDDVYMRAYSFSFDGGLQTWASTEGWGGAYDFAKNPTSDRDLKKDIVYTDGKDSYDRVMQWLPTTFKYKYDDIQRYGLIAQDLLKVDPQYVKVVPGAPIFEDVIGINEEGKEYVDHLIETGFHDDTLALDSNVILTDLSCAFVYQSKKVEKLEAELTELKQLVEKLINPDNAS